MIPITFLTLSTDYRDNFRDILVTLRYGFVGTIYGTSLVGLLSLPKCNNFFELIPLSESLPLIPHYLGELMAFQVKQTFYPTLHSMLVTAMLLLSIMALGAA